MSLSLTCVCVGLCVTVGKFISGYLSKGSNKIFRWMLSLPIIDINKCLASSVATSYNLWVFGLLDTSNGFSKDAVSWRVCQGLWRSRMFWPWSKCMYNECVLNMVIGPGDRIRGNFFAERGIPPHCIHNMIRADIRIYKARKLLYIFGTTISFQALFQYLQRRYKLCAVYNLDSFIDFLFFIEKFVKSTSFQSVLTRVKHLKNRNQVLSLARASTPGYLFLLT